MAATVCAGLRDRWLGAEVALTAAQAGPPERPAQGQAAGGTRLPAIARYWWVTALRGLEALTLALAITVGGRSTTRLVTFLALYWMTGGLITLRFALAIRPRPGFRLGLAAATAAVVGAVLVLLRDPLSGPPHQPRGTPPDRHGAPLGTAVLGAPPTSDRVVRKR